MELLFVDACPRGNKSRTLMLADRLLRTLQSVLPGLEITTHCLRKMKLKDVNAERLAKKEALCELHVWDYPLTRTGADFQRADAVVIAAPYWDLSFPSILKTWVENIWVRNLTFYYRDDQPVGLANGKAAVYVTTSGSYLQGHDWGSLYIEDVMKTLGISAFLSVKAEGLDLEGNDPETILREALLQADEAAFWLRSRLTEE